MMTTITFEMDYPAQHAGVSYLDHINQSSMPSTPVPIAYGPPSQDRGFQNFSINSQGLSSIQQPYIGKAPTTFAQSTAPVASIESQPGESITKTDQNKPKTFFGSVGETLGEVVGHGLSTVSSVFNVWKDYADSKNERWRERHNERAGEAQTIANIKSNLERHAEVNVAQSAAASAPAISTGADYSASSVQAPANITAGDSTNPVDPWMSFAERLASGKELWDPSSGKFVSIVRSINTEQESDFQKPPQETIVLHDHLLKWSLELGVYEHAHLLWDPEKGHDILVTPQIASLLTDPIYGLNAVNGMSGDKSQQMLPPDQAASATYQSSMQHPPPGARRTTLSLPTSQGSTGYIQPNPQPWGDTAAIRSDYPPIYQWPHMSAQTGSSSQRSFYPAPQMTSSESSYNSLNVTPPARARPLRSILKRPSEAVNRANAIYQADIASGASGGPRTALYF